MEKESDTESYRASERKTDRENETERQESNLGRVARA